MMTNTFKDFLKLESTSGILLPVTVLPSVPVANSPVAAFYGLLIEMPVETRK